MAATRSKSNIETKRWQHINLQTKTVRGKKYKMCTKCMKTLTKRGVVDMPVPGEAKFVHAVK